MSQVTMWRLHGPTHQWCRTPYRAWVWRCTCQSRVPSITGKKPNVSVSSVTGIPDIGSNPSRLYSSYFLNSQVGLRGFTARLLSSLPCGCGRRQQITGFHFKPKCLSSLRYPSFNKAAFLFWQDCDVHSFFVVAGGLSITCRRQSQEEIKIAPTELRHVTFDMLDRWSSSDGGPCQIQEWMAVISCAWLFIPITASKGLVVWLLILIWKNAKKVVHFNSKFRSSKKFLFQRPNTKQGEPLRCHV